jgi:hypothetical protein
MTISTFDVQSFRSSINKSYHRTAHFDMEISMPLGLLQNVEEPYFERLIEGNKSVRFNLESSNIPGIAFGTDENRRQGFGVTNLKPYVPIFDVINATVRSDSEGLVYDFFQSWMKLIINFDGRHTINNGRGFGPNRREVAGMFEIAYKTDYISETKINLYDEGGDEPTTVLTLMDCYPVHLGNANVDWRDNNILRFPVTFTFSSWYSGRDIASPVSETDLPPLT